MSQDTYATGWKRILKRTNIRHVGTHGIRHRATTEIANSGIPVKVGMQLTAHKTVTQFMRYVHTEDDPVRAAAETVAGAPTLGGFWSPGHSQSTRTAQVRRPHWVGAVSQTLLRNALGAAPADRLSSTPAAGPERVGRDVLADTVVDREGIGDASFVTHHPRMLHCEQGVVQFL